MPIKFRCTKCGKLLGIASRKAGTEVNCPICEQKLVVPSPDEAPPSSKSEASADQKKKTDKPSSEKKKKQGTEKKAPTDATPLDQKQQVPTEETTLPPQPSDIQDSPGEFDLSELVVYDDELPQQGVAATYLSGEQQPEAGQPVPLGMVLFPRRAYYIQAALILVMATVTFLAGFFIGRGTAEHEFNAMEEEARQRSFLEGSVYYNQTADERTGDMGTVVILLPEMGLSEVLKERIPTDGLRPGDPVPPDEMPSMQLLKKADGLYAQVDKDGDFHMKVPDTGIYNLLIISKNTNRGNNDNLNEADEFSMDRYFRDVTSLIGENKFKWQQIEVTRIMQPLEIEFGQSGK